MSSPIFFFNASTKAWDAVAIDDKNQAMETGGFQIKKVLSDALRDQNLAILAGSGSSLCVRNPAGAKLAPTMSDLWVEVVESNSEADFVITQVGYNRKAAKDLEDFLSFARGALDYVLVENVKNRLATFVKHAEAAIVERCSFVKPAVELSNHETFVRRIGRRSHSRSRVHIFTTNYDRCFEEALTRSGFIVVDGFSLNYPRRFQAENFSIDFVRQEVNDSAPTPLPNVVHLLKVHGSVDWWRDVNLDIRQGELPPSVEPLLIYPRSTKFQLAFQQPYLELMSKFKH